MKYVVTGRVQPERANTSFGHIGMKMSDGGSVGISCDASQLTINLTLPDIDGWATAKVFAEDMALIAVGALGFAHGSGYLADLIQVTEENGTPHVFGVRPSNPLQPTETLGFSTHTEVFNRAFRLAGRDVFFRLALRDYLQAINEVGDCATYCYRAVESIQSSFAFKNDKDAGWKEMHTALGTNKVEIQQTIKDYADPVRHGNWVEAKYTDFLIRWKMLSMTREILKKYLDTEQPKIS
ncbi:hypothetical protein [Pseudomonas sp. P1.31]|uniref:hypothetical protein n=1 Tax=Pseudomonas sp. P1.31 TaxID=1699311 RepID=UPI00069D0B1C|nr:hypothetical protein [Pseudomonas sp. P1.31]